MQVIILKLTDEEVKQLQDMVKDGLATEFEKKMYYSCYGLNNNDIEESIKSYL